MPDREDRLIAGLVACLAAGKITFHDALPALRLLISSTDTPDSMDELLDVLSEREGSEFEQLSHDLNACRLQDAGRFHERRKSGTPQPTDIELTLAGVPTAAPTEWTTPARQIAALCSPVEIARDRRFVATHRNAAPHTAEHLDQQYADIAAQAREALDSLAAVALNVVLTQVRQTGNDESLGAALQSVHATAQHAARTQDKGPVLDELRRRYESATGIDERRACLDQICCFSDVEAADVIRDVVQDQSDRERAALILTCRFGLRTAPGWAGWHNWLGRCKRRRDDDLDQLNVILSQYAAELLLMWLGSQKDVEPGVIDQLDTWCSKHARPVDADALIQRWHEAIPANEWNALIDVPIEVVDTSDQAEQPADSADVPARTFDDESLGPTTRLVTPSPRADPADVPRDEPRGAPAEPPPVPAGPSLWNDHLQPFLVEHWYLVAGVVMVIAGSSLLAYYTWDRHWLVRYTLMPVLLGSFTWTLAWLGGWIERRDEEFQATAAILRGAAIGLLPINFMAVAVLSNDQLVAHKAAAVPIMVAIYLTVFGLGLQKWCAGIQPRLGPVLGGTLLLLNSLVMLGPLAISVAHLAGNALHLVIGVGFHLGFCAMAAAVIRFTRQIITREMAEEQRVPWFVGGSLVVTFLQVFVWVHVSLRHVPHIATYAPMVILTGGLVLMAERRAAELREQSDKYRGESFVGFALVLMGVLMGATQPYVRILAFVLAGIVWLNQSRSRREPLHDWIGLTLLTLGGASVGVLDRFPGPRLPVLGLALAVAMGVLGHLVRRYGRDQLPRTCTGMQSVILMLSAVVAVLAQWHYRSPPLVTGVCLVLIVIGFAFRAWRDDQLRWVHSAMTILAIALPYLGCVDIEERTLRGNVMPFGLSVVSFLWLGWNWLLSRPGAAAENDRDAFSDSNVSAATGWTSHLIRDARSTVLLVYGSIAVAAMVLRVLIETDAGQPSYLHMAMDYCGPLMMAVVLALATWHSRSLIPAAMAAAIVIILFPEIRARFAAEFATLGWGTGLGGASSGLGLIILCFLLRPARFLENLGEGDRFMGRTLFPICRYDHTLFTWPLLGSALFLTVRTDTVSYIRNLRVDLGIRTAIALGVTAVTWTLLAAYERQRRGAVIGTYLGCFWLFLGICHAFDILAPDVTWIWPVLWTGIALQTLYVFYRHRLRSVPDGSAEFETDDGTGERIVSSRDRMFGVVTGRSWIEHSLATPTKRVLFGSTLVLALVCILRLLIGDAPRELLPLIAFIAAQLVWHGLTYPRPLHGGLLFALVWATLLSWTAPGSGPLLPRFSFDDNLAPTLGLLFAIQGCHLGMEVRPRVYEALRRLAAPILFLSSLLAIALLGWGLFEFVVGVTTQSLTGSRLAWHLALIVGIGLLTARVQSSLGLTLLSLVLACGLVQTDLIQTLGDGRASAIADRIETLCSPWRLGLFSVVLALLELGGRRVSAWNSRLLTGPFSQTAFRSTDPKWIVFPALIISSLATFLQTLSASHRDDVSQLPATFLAAAAWGVVGWSWRSVPYFIGSGVLFAIGNIHLVRVYLGDWLRGYDISDIQLICLGLAATLLELNAIRLIARREIITKSFNEASLALAALVLALLSLNYFVHPNLSTISVQRFIVSGSMAYLAGLYFRRAARSPMPGEEPYVNLAEGMYHFGVTLASWCALLLFPALRQPALSLFALGLPTAYFYFRAETGIRAGLPFAASYRNSATVLGFAVLFAYIFRFAFQMVLFPPDDLILRGRPLTEVLHADYYHSSAPFIMLLSLVLLRLHGLGGTSWLALYGGLAMVTGSWFTLTWLPKLSPFHHPMAGAWCAVGLAHFWTLVSNQHSPLRTAIQRLAVIDGQHWFQLRRVWGVCVLVATHVAVLWGLLDWRSNTFMVAPLVAGAASVLIHQGAIRRSPLYFVLAALELLIALHADFFVESHIDRRAIVWVLLGLWITILIAEQLLVLVTRNGGVPGIGTLAGGLAALTVAHVLYHRPWSAAGLSVFAIGGILAAFTPRRTRSGRTDEEDIAAALLCGVPAWLAFFSQAQIEQDGFRAIFRAWPALVTTGVILLTGLSARAFQAWLVPAYDRLDRVRPRLFDQTLSWFATRGADINSCALWFSFFATAAAQVVHYGRPFGNAELGLVLVLYALLATGWFHEGRLRHNIPSYVVLQLCVVAFFAVIRRQLMLTTDFWTPQYDVWASLIVSCALTGTKQYCDVQPREVRIPLLGTLMGLPVVALVWVLWNDLGTDVAMLVVGLHSLMFAFMGKDDRESPYNLVTVGGFVAFTLMLLHERLELRVIHAYTIPVGVGILALLQLFRGRIEPETRNRVRLVTLLTMIGSVGYYALLGTRYPIAFHLTMILVCLASMGIGSFFRIRLYVVLGFAGLLADVASIVYRAIAGIDERSTKMTIVGSLVLLIGVGLVFGAIYYKTHGDRINSRVDRWRSLFGAWE